MTFTEVMTRTSETFEVTAALVLALGLVWAVLLAIRAWRRSGDGRRGYAVLREFFGGVLLLALEILVAAGLSAVGGEGLRAARDPRLARSLPSATTRPA